MHLFKTYDEPGQDVAQRSDRHINPAGCGAWRGLDAPGKQPLKYLAAESRLKVSARIGREIILRWSIDYGFSNRVRLTVVVSNRVRQYILYPHCQVGSVGPEHSWLFQISNKWIGHIGWFSYRNTSCNRRSKNSRIIECGTPSKCNSQPNILCPSFVSALTKESIGSNGNILSNRPIWWKAKNRGKQDDAAIAKNRDLNLAMRNKMFVNRMTTCTIQCWELGVRNHSSPNGFYPDHKYGRQPTKKN